MCFSLHSCCQTLQTTHAAIAYSDCIPFPQYVARLLRQRVKRLQSISHRSPSNRVRVRVTVRGRVRVSNPISPETAPVGYRDTGARIGCTQSELPAVGGGRLSLSRNLLSKDGGQRVESPVAGSMRKFHPLILRRLPQVWRLCKRSTF